VSNTFAELAVALASELEQDPATLRSLGGASGMVWGVGDHVMRVGSREQLDHETAVTAAVSGYVPVPAVLGRVDIPDASAVLIEKMPGTPGWSEEMTDRITERRGESLGRLHERIAQAVAPPGTRRFTADGPGDRLMHFDLHPLNALFGEDDEVTGVIDWANARSGTAADDRARTAALLFLDPTARRLAEHSSLRAFIRGWARTAKIGEVSSAELEHAIEFMIRDLSGRHTTVELEPAHRALQDARQGRIELVMER
jgi:Ser/Thr protein kinase RdoA (MazF antagonist)